MPGNNRSGGEFSSDETEFVEKETGGAGFLRQQFDFSVGIIFIDDVLSVCFVSSIRSEEMCHHVLQTNNEKCEKVGVTPSKINKICSAAKAQRTTVSLKRPGDPHLGFSCTKPSREVSSSLSSHANIF